jgi:hypothetical protein
LAAHRKSIVARWCITLSVSKVLKAIGMEYCVIDRANALVHGPYETLDEACARADALTAWEIINGNGDLIDWSRGPVLQAAEERRSRRRTAGNGSVSIADESEFVLTVQS